MTGTTRKSIEAALKAEEVSSKELRASSAFKAQQAADLQRLCREWRVKADLTAARAADLLGMSKRTYEGIEQGRGFVYPTLLILALKAFD